MRWFHIGFVVLMLLVPVRRAEAAPIFFDFTLDFTSGPLAGQSFAGSLSVDGDDCTDIGGTCSGDFVSGNNLLSFDVTVGGDAFSLGTEVGPTSVRFLNDNITFVDYIGAISNNSLRIIGSTVFYGDPQDDGNQGLFIDLGRREVPEPASMLLLGIGLAGAGVRRWRQPRL